MSNFIIGGRHYLSSTGNGESTDPFILTTTEYPSSEQFNVTFVVDTSALADGDLASDVIEIPSVARVAGYVVNLKSIVIKDKADQKSALYVVFSNASTTFGSLNSAPSLSDANVANIVLGHVKIAATDYVDLGGASVATKVLDNPLPLKTASTTTSLWVALVSNGTPTYGAAGDVIATLTFARS